MGPTTLNSTPVILAGSGIRVMGKRYDAFLEEFLELPSAVQAPLKKSQTGIS
jgi:hypothetical protein